MIKSIKKNTKKQSTNKTKWGYQNQRRVGLCEQDNQIEGKTEKKKSLI